MGSEEDGGGEAQAAKKLRDEVCIVLATAIVPRKRRVP